MSANKILNPSKVKAADTVTLETDDGRRVTGPQFGHALVDGQSVHGFLTTSHHDEPHPMFVFPMPDGGYMQVSGEGFSDFVPDETRPLPTRVAMAEAMHDDRLPGGHPRLTYLQRLILADAIIANQRGESR
jgi:hypothetical protein